MSNPDVSNPNVPYVGLWRDYGSGRLILTTSSVYSGFLLGALVTWVHIIAASTWPIIRFILWRIEGRKRRGKGYRVFNAQRNVLLRNSGSANAAVSQVLRLITSWRSHSKPAVWGSLPFVITALLLMATWTIAGIFVPYIYTHSTSGMLLAHSSSCGFLDLSASDRTHPNVHNQDFRLKQNMVEVYDAQSYVQQCYGALKRSSICSSYPVQKLNYSSKVLPSCSSITDTGCVKLDSSTIIMETGYLNSNEDLGINTPRPEQINYRRRTTCYPVNLRPYYVRNTNGNLRVDLGTEKQRSHTYRLNVSITELTHARTYYLEVYGHFPHSDWLYDQWHPIIPLHNGTNADVTLITLQAGAIQNPHPVHDPFFLATRKVPSRSSGRRQFAYIESQNITGLLCYEQHQVCSVEGHCSRMVAQSGISPTSPAMQGLHFNQMQNSTITRLSNALSHANIYVATSGRSGAALQASRTVYNGIQTASLPEDQWQVEVKNWFRVSLAQLQASLLFFATGPTSQPVLRTYLRKPQNDSLAQQCYQQRIGRVAGYANFDFYPILILLVAGIILIPTGLFFDKLVVLAGRVFHLRKIKQTLADWTADGMFQLLKSALEADGVSDWLLADEDVPVSLQPLGSAKEHSGEDHEGRDGGEEGEEGEESAFVPGQAHDSAVV